MYSIYPTEIHMAELKGTYQSQSHQSISCPFGDIYREDASLVPSNDAYRITQ